jgi:hypothetical protein
MTSLSPAALIRAASRWSTLVVRSRTNSWIASAAGVQQSELQRSRARPDRNRRGRHNPRRAGACLRGR